MPRKPDERIIQAKELYLKGLKLVEIASQLNLPEGTVRRWKSTYKWDNERSDKKSERSESKKSKKKKAAESEVDQVIENPELILADEPTGNLDSNTSLQVIKTLVHINETLNKTVVMVTHDPKMASYGKRTLFLKDGVILDSLIKKESNEKYYEKILNKMVQI